MAEERMNDKDALLVKQLDDNKLWTSVTGTNGGAGFPVPAGCIDDHGKYI
jgi:hypothetical protein